ncbi:uncharacterized protein LOC125551256 isoform X2 [Triticum urartu]|uniref:uncharacterized protein LOC125551254 isoform X2 n=2 Tax=Triticum urartu TaxID=4572 RepID=UPI0020433AE1|nr:uncharacterized protein LOC125551254 isoform X2 [Triticum urartu]XP_048570386.1 uncharacterized protein LOC125551256 isoform X2 [Triticum urartu]
MEAPAVDEHGGWEPPVRIERERTGWRKERTRGRRGRGGRQVGVGYLVPSGVAGVEVAGRGRGRALALAIHTGSRQGVGGSGAPRMESCGAWVVRPIWMILHQFWFPTMATGASRPLRSALLLLQFRCAAIAKGRLLLSILPIWSIGGEPGCARRRWRPASVPRNPTRSSVEAMTSPPRNINSRQAIRLIRARQFTAVSNAILALIWGVKLFEQVTNQVFQASQRW